ncbi:ATP-dependent DNA ligase [Streptomyces sp. NPDC054834]
MNVTLEQPDLVAEVDVDAARDSAGRCHHPARRHRTRPDFSPTDVSRWSPH